MTNCAPQHRIKIGISSCLLGEPVRFDSSHKLDNYIVGTLGQYFDFIPICPEMGVGMGAPRPTIRLVKVGDDVRVRGVRNPAMDVTELLGNYLDTVVDQLDGICGYIVKSKSPTCGMERVRIYTEAGMPLSTGSGIYAGKLMQRFPLLPVEEEGRMGDPVLRENFIERVFVMQRWRSLLAEGLTAARLVEFHSRHKFMVMAHNQMAYRRLGQLVAQAGNPDLHSLATTYAQELMAALARRATKKGNANVLYHIAGYLKRDVVGDDMAELNELIEQYRNGLLPLIVPITLLKHYLRRYPDQYVLKQYYLNPHPFELTLRNVI